MVYAYVPKKSEENKEENIGTLNASGQYVSHGFATKRVFESGSQRDDDTNKPLVNHLDAYVRLRFGYLLRMGANKYEKNNWQKGQPDESSLESLHRHLAKYELGDRSEDHLACIMFGLQLIMKNEQKAGIEIDHYYIPIS
jgi:hypothetical protein